MPLPWPFNDPIATPAVILLFVGIYGWLSDKIKKKPEGGHG